MLKLQKSDAQLEIYKSIIEENKENADRVQDLEQENQRLTILSLRQGLDLKELDTYREAVTFLKEEVKESKQAKHLGALELDKARKQAAEADQKLGRSDKKLRDLESKHSNMQHSLHSQIEILQAKLTVYEETAFRRGPNDLAELNEGRDEDKFEEMEDRLAELEKEKLNLQRENEVLKNDSSNDINLRLLRLEQSLVDKSQELEALQHSHETQDSKVAELEEEIDRLRLKL